MNSDFITVKNLDDLSKLQSWLADRDIDACIHLEDRQGYPLIGLSCGKWGKTKSSRDWAKRGLIHCQDEELRSKATEIVLARIEAYEKWRKEDFERSYPEFVEKEGGE